MSIFVGCASSPQLSNIPQREHSRSLKLPKGVTEFELNLNSPFIKTSEVYDFIQPIPLRFFWSHAVSEKLEFLWFVLPLGFRLDLGQSEEKMGSGNPAREWMFEMFTHIEPTESPTLNETIQLYQRFRIDSDWLWDSRLSMQLRGLFKASRFEYAFSFQSGPRLQVTDMISFHSWFSMMSERAQNRNAQSLLLGISPQIAVLPRVDLDLHLVYLGLGNRVLLSERWYGYAQLRYRW